MSKALLKIAKIIPRFASGSDSDKLMCLNAIEKLLKTEDLDWVSAGVKLGEFLTEILGIPDEILLPPEPAAKPNGTQSGGWTTVNPSPPPRPQPAAPPSGGWQSTPNRPQAAPQARPAYTPPPRPTIDPRCRGSKAEKLACILDIIAKAKPGLTSKETDDLKIIEMLIKSGLPIKTPQQRKFEQFSTRL